MGCWTPTVKTSINAAAAWNSVLDKADGSSFSVYFDNVEQGKVNWSLTGEHNVYNALSAIVAAKHIGILPGAAITALAQFKNVKRRMEIIAKINNVTLYDDFAHHPTAIQTTLDGLRKQVGKERIVAIVEPRSNTMRLGTHTDTLAQSFNNADLTIIYQPSNLNWDLSQLSQQADNIEICTSIDDIITRLQYEAPLGGHFVMMSNGSFGGLYQRLQTALAN
jgi:UDP-N-acetylmuramate: L-alanyl-gamma-D-glutamyl-meso-diaminopimelate ligase